jgi:hypothetical protein
MGLIRTLFEGEQELAQTALPEELRDLYGGDLHFPASPAQRPYVIGNFVCTLDGFVSFKVKGRSGGRAISGSVRKTASSWVCCGLLSMPLGSNPGRISPPHVPNSKLFRIHPAF